MHRARRWEVTHSLTPQPELSLDVDYRIDIPQIPQAKKVLPAYKYHNSQSHRSRKHRLAEQRSTQIEKTNRMLYQKIRKIMQKGHSSEKKVEPCPQQSPQISMQSQFLNTSIKPLSLPHVRSNIFSMRDTKSQLNTILGDRPKFAQKYFQELSQARKNAVNVHTEEMGNFNCFGWKVKVLKLNHGEFLALSGKKGKKEIKKKYIFEKVRAKVESNLEEWVNSKFQFQL